MQNLEGNYVIQKIKKAKSEIKKKNYYQTVREMKTWIYMKKPKLVQATKKVQEKSFKNLKKESKIRRVT